MPASLAILACASRTLGVFPLRRPSPGGRYEASRPIFGAALLGAAALVLMVEWDPACRLLAAPGRDRAKGLFVGQLRCAACLLGAFAGLALGCAKGRHLARLLRVLARVDALLASRVGGGRWSRRRRALLLAARLQVALVLTLGAVGAVVGWEGTYASFLLLPIGMLRVGAMLVEQQLVHVALLLRECFLEINTELRRASAACHQASWVCPLRTAHRRSASCVEEATDAFGLGAGASALQMLVEGVAGGFSFLPGEGVATLGAAFCVADAALRLLLLCWTAGDTARQSRMTGSLVVRLIHGRTEPEMRYELEAFAAQTAQTDAMFHVLGLFTLDMSLPLALTQAATSYLLVLAQFQPE